MDMWRPFINSIAQWAQHCRIVYDKFHVLQHANKAIDEVRRAEFFRKGGRMRGVVKGKRWLLLTRWMNLDSQKRQQLNDLFALNRRVMKAWNGCGPIAMREPWCATCRVGSINCAGNDCHPFKDWPRCWRITWMES